jgi:hypothetical protein
VAGNLAAEGEAKAARHAFHEGLLAAELLHAAAMGRQASTPRQSVSQSLQQRDHCGPSATQAMPSHVYLWSDMSPRVTMP